MKYIVITKKHLMIFCSLFLASIIGIICSVGVLANSDKKLPIYCVDTPDKKVALSFDAAWGNNRLRLIAN